MTRCLSEQGLLAVATGEGGSAERDHASTCTACAARLAALDRDLLLLRGALRDAPLPVGHRRPRSSWAPMAAALAATALVALVWAAPWQSAPRGGAMRIAQVSPLAGDVSAALFASARPQAGAEPLSDGAYLAAALNGGWRCRGLELYGMDCQSADMLAELEE